MNTLETGLYNALVGDAALVAELGGSFVYNQHAPQGQARPYVIFSHAGGGPENLTPSDLRNHVYLVKAIAEGLKQAGDVDELVIDVLHGSELTVSGYTNFWMAREEEVQLAETARDGTTIYHRGGYYRIRIDD